MECSDLAFEIMKDYDSGMYTQQQLSDKYNIPLEIIMKLTQQFGYSHCKRELKKVVIVGDEVDYLQPYSNKKI